MLPPGFEPGIIGLRSQYAWPDYTTGAYRNKDKSQFKAITFCLFSNFKNLIIIYIEW